MVRRPTPPPVWDSLIAEDGRIFLSQALSQQFLDSLATSYQGYLHTAPRLITVVATWLPLDQAPLVMSLLCAIVVALLSVYVYRASAAWIASPVLRAVLALAVPFIPLTARQMAGTVSNLHWYLLYAAFWAVVCPWRTRGWLAASTAVVGLAVTSDPQVAVLLPVAAVFAVRARDRSGWVVPATIVLGLVAQLALRDQGTATLGGANYGALPEFFAERVTSSLLIGDRYLHGAFGGMTGSAFAWCSLALAGVAVAAGLALLRGRRLWLLGGGAALAVVYFLIAPLARGTRIWPIHDPWVLTGTRYLYLPVLFLFTGLLAAVDRPRPESGRLRKRELAVAAVAVAAMAAGYAAPHRSSGELRWKPVLAKARLACATGRPVAPIKLYGAGSGLGVFVPIDPVPRWSVQIGCSDVR
jgi:hypothetical protein